MSFPLSMPIAGPLSYPIARYEGGGDPILAAFADGTDGFYFDFSKTDQLFQDLGGTPADGAGENIWLGLESHSSLWGSKTLAQLVAYQTEKITNPNFDTDTAWSKSVEWLISGGLLTGTVLSNATNKRAYQSIATTSGRLLRIDYEVTEHTGSGYSLFYGTTSNVASAGVFRSGTGAFVEYVFAPAATTYIGVGSRGASMSASLSVTRFSVKEIPGNHGLQATTAAQPKWQTGGLARFDGLDDYHATTLVPAAAFTFMFKLKMPAKGAGTKIISGCRNATDTRSYIGMNNDGTLGGGLGSQGSTTITGSVDHGGGTGVATMAWDGSRVELLWNAVREYEAAQAGSIQTAQAIFVGGWNDGGVASAFAGTDVFHALAVKKRLTQAQIAAITNLWGTS